MSHESVPFDRWAVCQFAQFVGLDREAFARAVDWGEDTGKPVHVPRRSVDPARIPVLAASGERGFVGFDPRDITESDTSCGRLRFGFDVISATGWLLAGAEELHAAHRDGYGRWAESNSIVARAGLAALPAVNGWASEVRRFLQHTGWALVDPWPEGKRFAVALTHDVDNPRYVFAPHVATLARGIRSADTLAVRHGLHKLAGSAVVTVRDRFRAPVGISRLMEVERALGVRSTILVYGLDGRCDYRAPHDPSYDVAGADLAESLHAAARSGFEVGMHAAINTAPHEDRYREQARRIAEITSAPVRSNRHHYWNVTREGTAEALEAMGRAGLEVDSSISLYSSANFRRSVAFPFQPFNPRNQRVTPLLEIPATFMDAWVDPLNPAGSVREHLDRVAAVQGIAVLNWHANRFNNRQYAVQRKAYERIVADLIQREDVWLTTLESAAAWWKARANRLCDPIESGAVAS